jgi:hypothetical protein
MIADGVPEVAQARRLGHILGDRIQQTYSHVAAEVKTLQERAGSKPWLIVRTIRCGGPR